jgi:hypothetical protein
MGVQASPRAENDKSSAVLQDWLGRSLALPFIKGQWEGERPREPKTTSRPQFCKIGSDAPILGVALPFIQGQWEGERPFGPLRVKFAFHLTNDVVNGPIRRGL